MVLFLLVIDIICLSRYSGGRFPVRQAEKTSGLGPAVGNGFFLGDRLCLAPHG